MQAYAILRHLCTSEQEHCDRFRVLADEWFEFNSGPPNSVGHGNSEGQPLRTID